MLREENLRLYQKVRFLESVRTSGRGISPTMHAGSEEFDEDLGMMSSTAAEDGTEELQGLQATAAAHRVAGSAAKSLAPGDVESGIQSKSSGLSQGGLSSAQSARAPRSKQDSQLLRKYEAMYDRRSNPFQTFKRRERQRREANMNALDRGTLMCARTLASSRTARVTMAVYLIILHLLAFAVLWVMAHSETGATRQTLPRPLSKPPGPVG